MIAVPGSWHGLSLPATIGPLLGDESDSAFLVPFVKLGTDEGRDEINAAEDPRTEYDKFVTLLTPCVVALDGYWKRRWTKRSVAKLLTVRGC
jgi:hypothetical protein